MSPLRICRQSVLTETGCNPARAGGCGFFGSAQLMFFCSVCFKKTHGEEEFKRRTMQAAAEKNDHPAAKSEVAAARGPQQTAAAEQTAAADPGSSSSSDGAASGGIAEPAVQQISAEESPKAARESRESGTLAEAQLRGAGAGGEQPAAHTGNDSGGKDDESAEPASKKMAPSRCMSCKKKVGLLGFHCRCGGTYCEKHRYSDKHDCTFDYKAHGRDQVSPASGTGPQRFPGILQVGGRPSAVSCEGSATAGDSREALV